MNPLFAFVSFEVGRLVRSWRFLMITIGFPVVFYMLFVSDHRASQVVDGTLQWRSYLLVTMCSFGTLVAALTAAGARLSSERSSGWARQLRVTPLPGWSYLVTKVVATMVVVAPELFLVEVVGVGFGGAHLSLAMWFELAGVLWVAAIPFAILGVFVGSTVNAETAFPVVIALMFVLGYFGGLFSPVQDLPHGLQVAAHVLPSFHGAAVGVAVLDGRATDVFDWLILGAYAAGLGGLLLLRHRLDEVKGLA